MSEEELATVRSSTQNIRTMVEKTALAGSGDPYHTDLYMNVHGDGVVTLIGGKPGATLQSYCTFTPPYLEEITSVHENGTQTIIDVADFLTYGLDFASDGGELQFSLRGDEEADLASVTEFYGAVNARIMNPVAGNPLEDVPTEIVDNFPEGDGEYRSTEEEREGEPFPTHLRVNSEEIHRLIEVVDHVPDEVTELYPLTVEEGELTMDVGTEGERNAVWGELSAEEVDGPDFSNEYKKGFEEVFKSLSGELWLQTATNAAPICVVEDSMDGVTLRHVIGSMAE